MEKVRKQWSYNTAITKVDRAGIPAGTCVKIWWYYRDRRGIDWYFVDRTQYGPCETISFADHELTDFVL